jgi:hypothetical protein
MTTRTATPTVLGSQVVVANLRQASLAVAISQITAADAAIEKHRAARQAAVDKVNVLFGIGKHVVAGVGEVTISENNTYSDAAIRADLTDWQFTRRASKRVVDKAKVKANYPAVYEAARQAHGVRGAAKVY